MKNLRYVFLKLFLKNSKKLKKIRTFLEGKKIVEHPSPFNFYKMHTIANREYTADALKLPNKFRRIVSVRVKRFVKRFKFRLKFRKYRRRKKVRVVVPKRILRLRKRLSRNIFPKFGRYGKFNKRGRLGMFGRHTKFTKFGGSRRVKRVRQVCKVVQTSVSLLPKPVTRLTAARRYKWRLFNNELFKKMFRVRKRNFKIKTSSLISMYNERILGKHCEADWSVGSIVAILPKKITHNLYWPIFIKTLYWRLYAM